jgi:cell division protein DivIC
LPDKEGVRMSKRERARKSSAERTRLRRRKKQNKSSMVCITLIVLMLVGVMSVQIVSVYGRNQTYQAQEAELEAQLESEKARKEEIKEYEKYINTKEYIEQVAKTKLGLVYPNEVIFKENEASQKE